MEASERWARALRRASRPQRGSLAAAGAVSVMASPRRSSAVFTSESLRQGPEELNPQNSLQASKAKTERPGYSTKRDESPRVGYRACQGSRSRAPLDSKSLVLRVTRVRSRL